MSGPGEDGVDIPCNEFVEIVTDYLDGALAPGVVAGIDAHLEVCSGCASVLEQFRETIRLSGRLSTQDVARVEPAVRVPLMDAFRQHHRSGI
jgi:anti-sigma factor RsiW